ncbi:3'-5' exonuclease [Variovorax paradoxus]|uniref:3'-5' exonuclease n=1 Tax=Variovorax paradoxus TaxID=34073 RepID=A0A5Q0M4K3_VARPD|nr:3'-5' exonuclease [Variovorax paradoxus]QFZ84551.1 3'-5' exonuclease [Variovorax paradoxus]
MSRSLAAFYDSESTGLKQEDGHRLIEVAAHIYDLDSKARVGRFVQRINPQRGIDPDAQAIHDIAFDELINEPTWEEVGPKLSKILSACTYVVAHNGEGFDLPFTFREFIRIGAPVPKVRSIDSMLQARWATGDGSLPNLKALCFACGVDYDPTQAHAADYDVDVMAKCFFSQVDRGFFTLPTEYYELPPLTVKKGKK